MFPKDSLHHAYFIEGDKVAIVRDIDTFLTDSFGIVRQGHPDVHYAAYEAFGIDEGRLLQEMQGVRPFMGDKKIFIITLNSITSEAQNSLLKVFEEPTPGAHFFVVSSSARILLPTLRSRMVVVTHSSKDERSHGVDAKKFISSSIKDRLEYVADIIESKDKSAAEEFLQSVVLELSKKGLSKVTHQKTQSVKEILTLITYLKDRAPSLKLILERVALLDLV